MSGSSAWVIGRPTTRIEAPASIAWRGVTTRFWSPIWPKGFFVVPGVRLPDGQIGDQKRVVTPRQAMNAGASILVVGRPITQAEDPDIAARAIGATL